MLLAQRDAPVARHGFHDSPVDDVQLRVGALEIAACAFVDLRLLTLRLAPLFAGRGDSGMQERAEKDAATCRLEVLHVRMLSPRPINPMENAPARRP